MKPCIFTFILLVAGIILMIGCGESEYNKTTLSDSILQEIDTNESITTHNENWQKFPLNAEGYVLSTNLSTNETITKFLVSDEDGKTDSLDLSITIVELIDGSYTADGRFFLQNDLTINPYSELYSFINLPVSFDNSDDDGGVYKILGDSAITSTGIPNFSFEVKIKREQTQYYSNVKITDHTKNLSFEIDVEIKRIGGNGPGILFPLE